jgi:hypothetical protein
MIRSVVQIKHEDGQLENFEVQHGVPKDEMVVDDEALAHHNLVSLFCDDVEELLVEGHGRQKGDGLTLAAFGVAVLLLAVNGELGYEALLADGALDSVIAEVFLEPGENLLFS